MSTTTVILSDDSMGLCVPSVNSVPIEVGAQVTFTAADGVNAALYFSPATAAILSPAPGASVALAPGQSITYTVSSVGTTAYGVLSQPPQFPQAMRPSSVPHPVAMQRRRAPNRAHHNPSSVD